tara:strand:- start:180 stop:485 length:306 start_codon:yes stop_codon:yes gene_type:complete
MAPGGLEMVVVPGLPGEQEAVLPGKDGRIAPIPNNCSRFPRLGDPDPDAPVSCWVISRTILRVIPDPSELQPRSLPAGAHIPNISDEETPDHPRQAFRSFC